MDETYSFGEWLKQRRKQLHLTQKEVATAVFCSTAMIKKIEADERQPSVELAQALAVTLQNPTDKQHLHIIASLTITQEPTSCFGDTPPMISAA